MILIAAVRLFTTRGSRAAWVRDIRDAAGLEDSLPHHLNRERPLPSGGCR